MTPPPVASTSSKKKNCLSWIAAIELTHHQIFFHCACFQAVPLANQDNSPTLDPAIPAFGNSKRLPKHEKPAEIPAKLDLSA
jgi:hypothetical protein